MFTQSNNEPIEVKLMKMPFPQMLDALSAIAELDNYILAKLDEFQDQSEADFQQAQVSKRRSDREKFINLRIAMEFGRIANLHS